MFYITLARVIDIPAVCATAFLFVLFTLKQGFLNALSSLCRASHVMPLMVMAACLCDVARCCHFVRLFSEALPLF
jgi:hypothetical protein